MKKEYIKLKETELINNCPECYAQDGMTLVFMQERLVSKFMIRITNTIIDRIECEKCESIIFPGIWTDDIERTYAYHKKTITPQPTSIRFTAISYIIMLIILLLIAGSTYVFINY